MRATKQRRFRLRIWRLGVLCLAGCAGDSEPTPPTIRFGEEACVHCRMIISDGRFAAALTADNGQALKFDDIGCLLDYQAAHSEPNQRYWVGDFVSAAWHDAEQAVFVQSADLMTPMASGLVALSTADEARRVAEPLHGTVLRFDELDSARSKVGESQVHTDSM